MLRLDAWLAMAALERAPVILGRHAAPKVCAQPLGPLQGLLVVARRLESLATPCRRVFVGVARVLTDEVAAVGVPVGAELVAAPVGPHDARELGFGFPLTTGPGAAKTPVRIAGVAVAPALAWLRPAKITTDHGRHGDEPADMKVSNQVSNASLTKYLVQVFSTTSF